MEANILLIGGTGTVGSPLVDHLHQAKKNFTVLTRSDEKSKALHKKGVKSVLGNLADYDSLKQALKGIDKVFLLSSPSPTMPKWEKNLIKAALTMNVAHVVKLSAMGASPTSHIGIAQWHGEVETELKNSGLAYTILQPASFMQNLLGHAQSVKTQAAMYNSWGEGKVNLIDARDIAAAAFATLTGEDHTGKTYVLTGPEAVSMYEVAAAIGEATGKAVKYMPVSIEDEKKAMLDRGLPQWLADSLIALHKAYAANEVTLVTQEVEKLTGKKPHTIRDFARDYADVFR